MLPVCSAMHDFLTTLSNGDRRDEYSSPRTLLAAIQQYKKLKFDGEDDAYWFLQVLLDVLDDELRTESKSVSKFFSGMKNKHIKCDRCHVETVLAEPFCVNTLPLPAASDRRFCMLEECLLSTTKEKLEGYLCRSCHQRGARSSILVSQLPQVFCFHFNRSNWTGRVVARATRSSANTKIKTRVKFPLMLDMTPCVFEQDQSNIFMFKLTCVIVHDGLTAFSGHYFCYCFNSELGKWYKFNDAHTPEEVSQQTVLNCNPFMLFYDTS